MSQSKCIDPYDRFRLYWAHNQGGDNHSEQQFSLGKDPATKSDDFLEKFQKGFAPPPPYFWKIIVQFFFIMDMVAFMQGGIGQIISVNISRYQYKS